MKYTAFLLGVLLAGIGSSYAGSSGDTGSPYVANCTVDNETLTFRAYDADDGVCWVAANVESVVMGVEEKIQCDGAGDHRCKVSSASPGDCGDTETVSSGDTLLVFSERGADDYMDDYEEVSGAENCCGSSVSDSKCMRYYGECVSHSAYIDGRDCREIYVPCREGGGTEAACSAEALY